MSTAFTVPAFAEIETVVVTAEKKAEDLQTVPIAVTALSATDLKQKEIATFKDLQFNVPNLTFAKTGLGSGVVAMRGIGQAAGDPGISLYQNGVFSSQTNLASSDYFDIASIEVLRGPQGTLYGRASVGGLINITTSTPDLDAISAAADVTYGEFNTIKSSGFINLPIISDKLAVRVAGQYNSHDGNLINTDPGQAPLNSENTYSVRGSIRWQPTPDTTIDISGQYSNEADTRTRLDGSGCHTDPTGVLGCLPDSAPVGGVANTLGNAIGILDSRQALQQVAQGTSLAELGGFGLFGVSENTGGGAYSALVKGTLNAQFTALCGAGMLSAGTCTAMLAAGGPVLSGTYTAGFANNLGVSLALLTGFGNVGKAAGLFDLTQVTGSLGSNQAPNPQRPTRLGQTWTQYPNQYDDKSQKYSFHLHQTLASWLSADVVAGYNAESTYSVGAYGYNPTDQYNNPFYTNSFTSSSANNPVGGLLLFEGLTGASAGRLATIVSQYFPNYGAIGQAQLFPMSSFQAGGIRNPVLISNPLKFDGGIDSFVTGGAVRDLQEFRGTEKSVEMRFNSSFEGPFNFTAGLFHYQRESHAPHASPGYQVVFNGADYFGMFYGAALNSYFPSGNEPVLPVQPKYQQPQYTRQTSNALFIDMNYDIIPDTLVAKGGLRWQEDRQQLYFNHYNFASIVSPSTNCPLYGCFAQADTNAANVISYSNFIDSANAPGPVTTTDRVNGRAVLQWTPHLSFTDQTMGYVSYALGSKAGGVNGVTGPAAAFIPATIKPEDLTSYEVGLKNTLFDGTLQANLTGWYYDYKNFQYTVVAYATLYTANFNARMWGFEGEFIWHPTDDLAFNLNVTNTDSSIGNGQYSVDVRNPTAGAGNAVLIKNFSLTGGSPGQNCVLIVDDAGAIDPAMDPGVNQYYATQGTANAFAAPFGTEAGATSLRTTPGALTNVQWANYGTCSAAAITAINTYLNGKTVGLHTYGPQTYHVTSAADGPGSSNSGIGRPLGGHQVLGLPPNTINVGAQYTFHIDGFRLVPRVDYYYQNGYFSRIENDAADSVGSWDQLNMSLQLNAPEDQWYAKVYATNVINTRSIQGSGVQSDASGLVTGYEAEDPRVIGFTLGARY